MDKSVVLDTLIKALKVELSAAVGAAKDAADYATNEESKAESQWDTQGLEASYLAAGQAGQARQWAKAIDELHHKRSLLLEPKTSITLGALFTCEFGAGSVDTFFFAGVAGGQTFAISDREVTVITSQSPLIARLRGLKAEATFYMPNGKLGRILSVC